MTPRMHSIACMRWSMASGHAWCSTTPRPASAWSAGIVHAGRVTWQPRSCKAGMSIRRGQDAEGPAAPAPDEDHLPAGSSPVVVDEAAAAAKADEAERNRGDTQALSAELEALLASAELAD